MTPSDWANNLVQEKREKEHQKRVQEEARITDWKRIEANSEAKWQHIRKLLHDYAADLNEAASENVVTVENVTSHETKIAVGTNSGEVKFIARDHQLSVPFYGSAIQLRVTAGDLLWESTAERHKCFTDEEIARRSIERIWKGFQ